MKRWLSLLLALIMTVCLLPADAAAAAADKISIGLDEGGNGCYIYHTVQPVRITFNGKELESDVPAFVYKGRTMVPVRLISEKLNAVVEWDPQSGTVKISLNEQTVCLLIGSSLALINGKLVTLQDDVPVVVAKFRGIERVMVPLRFVSEQLGLNVGWIQDNSTAAICSVDHSDMTVVLDAGHGGGDPGAVIGNVYEKNINLAVATKVKNILTANGYQVIMTRDSDVRMNLNPRARMANQAGADAFVSIHSNICADEPNYAGIYTFYYKTHQGSSQLAQNIQSAICAESGAIDRGIAHGDYQVLRTTKMSAALVELGFMTNSEELRNLTDPSYQAKLAEGIAQGIMEYLNRT